MQFAVIIFVGFIPTQIIFLRLACPDPPTRNDLEFSPTPSVYAEGDEITYFCTNGQLSGSTVSTCNSNGIWSLTVLPTCFPCKT